LGLFLSLLLNIFFKDWFYCLFISILLWRSFWNTRLVINDVTIVRFYATYKYNSRPLQMSWKQI
jgi:hypothetical protein